jgi:hypothetical protein
MLTKRSKYANKTQDDEAVALMPGFDPARLFFDDLQVGFYLFTTSCPQAHKNLASLRRHFEDFLRSIRW